MRANLENFLFINLVKILRANNAYRFTEIFMFGKWALLIVKNS